MKRLILNLLIPSLILLSFTDIQLQPEDLVPVAQLPRVLVITGGHSFDTTEFYDLFQSIECIRLDTHSHPHVQDLLFSENLNADVLVFYDYIPDMPKKDSSIYQNLTRLGIPMLFLHHSICSFQTWNGFKKMVGGKYVMKGFDSDASELSNYKHDLEIHISVVDDNHPVTAGMDDFDIHDEGYSNIEMVEGITPLLQTDHPESSSPVAWINYCDQSTIITLLLGHDRHAYENIAFRQFVVNSIFWLTG